MNALIPPAPQTMLGRLLRFPLRLIPPEAQVRILRGPLRGRKWIAGASSAGYWFGLHEASWLKSFGDAIRPGAAVYDIGANVGLFTLLAGVRASSSGHVYAFEPAAHNLSFLRRHVALNQLQNCTLVEAAVSDVEGSLRFSFAAWGSAMGRIAPDGELEVPAVTMDGCVYGAKAFRPPNVIKIDVEGAEREVLRGAARTISEFHPKIFVEVHGTQHHADCKAFLLSHNYQVHESYGYLAAT